MINCHNASVVWISVEVNVKQTMQYLYAIEVLGNADTHTLCTPCVCVCTVYTVSFSCQILSVSYSINSIFFYSPIVCPEPTTPTGLAIFVF